MKIKKMEEFQCSICSELFIKTMTLQCSHSFCEYCIVEWKKTRSTCPICRTKITYLTHTLVLDNYIEKSLLEQNDECRKIRQELIKQREESLKKHKEEIKINKKDHQISNNNNDEDDIEDTEDEDDSEDIEEGSSISSPASSVEDDSEEEVQEEQVNWRFYSNDWFGNSIASDSDDVVDREDDNNSYDMRSESEIDDNDEWINYDHDDNASMTDNDYIDDQDSHHSSEEYDDVNFLCDDEYYGMLGDWL